MKKVLIILLFIIFSSNFSLAKNNEKITIEEIQDILVSKQPERSADAYYWHNINDPSLSPSFNCSYCTSKHFDYLKAHLSEKRFEKIRRSETFKKRAIKRVPLKMCNVSLKTIQIGFIGGLECQAKILLRVFKSSEQGKIRRPGDVFYALEAIERLVFSEETIRKYVYTVNADYDFLNGKIDHPWWNDEIEMEGVVCEKYYNFYNDNEYICSKLSKYTLKKLEKFKKDPSNEKALGWKLIKHIKNVRMIRSIREKIGTGNYALLGDMLNAAVVDVRKNNIRPDLKQRRVLLKKYSLILSGIKKKLDEDNYKSINKDVSKLSKTFKKLKALKPTTHKLDIEIDEAVNIIFDTNKLIEISTLKAKDNKEEKSLALASINFMESLIESILSVIPKKYHAITKELSPDLFNDEDLAELEVIIDTMMKKNKETKSAKWTKSMDIINKYINTSDVLKTLNNLGMKNSISRAFTQDTAAEIVNQQIRDNLDKEIFKDVRKIVQEMDKNDLVDLTKVASEVAKEVSNVAKETSSSSEPWSIGDKKFGNFTLKQIIHASRNR